MSSAIGNLQLSLPNAIHATFFPSFKPYLSEDIEKVTVKTFLHRCQSRIPFLFWDNPILQLKNSTEAALHQITGALPPLLEFSLYKERTLTLLSHKNTQGTASWKTFLPHANTTLAVLHQKCLSQTSNLFHHALDFLSCTQFYVC